MKMKYNAQFLVFCVFSLLDFCKLYPVHNVEEAVIYLLKYGYLENNRDDNDGATPDANTISDAFKAFQQFSGIAQTGILDRETKSKMSTPRCGLKDKIRQSHTTRRKRFILEGSKWKKPYLAYRISKYPTQLKDKLKIDREIYKAFKIWSDEAQLSFVERKRGRVNIDIRFESEVHEDCLFTFDNDTLGHATYPRRGGKVHLYDEMKWDLEEDGEFSLFEVAAHEIGHSLGLEHSDERNSMMTALYLERENYSDKLHEDDVKAIQALYGPNTNMEPQLDEESSELTPDPNNAPNLCDDASIDAITRTQNGSLYVFKGYFYWELLKNGIANGYPRKISDDWNDLEGSINAALTWPNGKTYIFKGSQYWRFTNKEIDIGYPRPISAGFEGIPNQLDAAFVFSRNNKTYFFKGNKYWRYDSHEDPPVSSEYPKSTRVWKRLPSHIDAAFQWRNGKTYFFKDDQYFRFNDTSMKVDAGYPGETSVVWFKC